MQTIVTQLDQAFRTAIKAAFDIESDPLIGVGQNDKFGDYQANAAMGLAKSITEKTGRKTNPRAVAEQIKAKLDLGDIATEVTIAGPGFINVRLSPQWLARQLATIGQTDRVGVETVEKPQTVVVDYSGPNIAKELHVGHLRSTIIGDAVFRVLSFQGHRVIRQNHIGDWGTQFGRVILAIWHLCMSTRRGEPDYAERMGKSLSDLSKREKEAKEQKPLVEAELAAVQTERRKLVEQIAARQQEDLNGDPDGVKYFEPFLETYAADLDQLLPAYQFVTALEDAPEAAQVSISGGRRGITRPLGTLSRLVTSDLQQGAIKDPLNRQEEKAWRKVRDATMEECQRIYDQLGVLLSREDEHGESRYHPMLASVVEDLKKLGLAVESQGAVAVFIDGPDSPPIVIEKAGGEGYLYATTDLAAIRYRVSSLRAERIIYLVDARQAHHFNQVFALAKQAGWTGNASLEHAAFGTMLGADGRPFKTRSGGTVKLKDLLDEAEERALKLVTERNPEMSEAMRGEVAHAVGIGGVKYSDLSKDRTSDYLFSFEAMLALNGNTAPYMQYAHARIRSIFRQAAERGINYAGSGDAAITLESPYEIALAKHILRLGEIVELVGRELKPHHLCTYLYELAGRFSGFSENCPVLKSDEPLRTSRLVLVDLTARTIARGLDLLGIQHPDQM